MTCHKIMQEKHLQVDVILTLILDKPVAMGSVSATDIKIYCVYRFASLCLDCSTPASVQCFWLGPPHMSLKASRYWAKDRYPIICTFPCPQPPKYGQWWSSHFHPAQGQPWHLDHFGSHLWMSQGIWCRRPFQPHGRRAWNIPWLHFSGCKYPCGLSPPLFSRISAHLGRL